MLGPARFTHIADCARAVCTAMFEQEKAAERASKAADLVAQLREWDTEVTELRMQIAVLEAKEKKDACDKQTEEMDKSEEEAKTGRRIPAYTPRAILTLHPEQKPKPSVSLKPPDYTSILNPPDVERAERLLQARRKTVQSLKAVLEKKQQPANDTQ